MNSKETSNFNPWIKGVKNGLPICFGYFAVSFAFGIQAKQSGLSVFQSFLMSFTNLTSAGQFASLGLITAGASYLEMMLTQLVLNMRYCLMSCALSQKLGSNIPLRHRFFMAYSVTDEIFGVSICRDGEINPFYYYGLMSSAVPGWCLGTLLGVVSGNFLPLGVISAFGIAIYGMFIAVIVPAAKKDRMVLKVVIFSIAASTLFRAIPVLKKMPSGFQIILITILIAGIAAWAFPVKEAEAVA